MKTISAILVAFALALSGCAGTLGSDKVSEQNTLLNNMGQTVSGNVDFDKDVAITRMVSEFRSKCLANISNVSLKIIEKEIAADTARAYDQPESSEGEVAKYTSQVAIEAIRSNRGSNVEVFNTMMSGTCSQMSDYYKYQLALVEGKGARQAVRHATYQNLGGKILGTVKAIGLGAIGLGAIGVASGGSAEFGIGEGKVNAGAE